MREKRRPRCVVRVGRDPALDEEQLLDGLVARDSAALSELLQRYTRDVYGVVARVLAPGGTPEEIEEAASEAFLAAWNGASRFDPGRAPLRTWLLMHAKYAALEHARKSRRWERPLPLKREIGPPDPFEALAVKEERQKVQDALAQLPPLDREIVYRRYFLEEEITSLAKALGLTRRAVDMRLWRARQALRGLLGRRDEETGGGGRGAR